MQSEGKRNCTGRRKYSKKKLDWFPSSHQQYWKIEGFQLLQNSEEKLYTTQNSIPSQLSIK